MANSKLCGEILSALRRVVERKGLAGTTLDAVAHEVGTSKARILYYFSNKKDLLCGMMEQYEVDFLRRRGELLAHLPDKRNSLLLATVQLMVWDMDAKREDIPNIANLLEDSDIRDWVVSFKRKLFVDATNSMGDAENVALIKYIVDGLWLDIRFNPRVIAKKNRNAAIDQLLKTIRELDA